MKPSRLPPGRRASTFTGRAAHKQDMSIDRAPKGIPSGGQFVATAHAEPHLTLAGDALAARESPRPRNLGISAGGARIIDWDTKDPVSYKSVTPEEMAQLEQLSAESGVSIPTAPLLTSFKRRGHREIGTRSSRPFDFTSFTYLRSDDLTADERELMADLMPDILAQELRDTQDIPAVGRSRDTAEETGLGTTSPTPAARGAFAGWGQMLPKFLRRKDKSEQSDPEPGAGDRNRRLAKVFGDLAVAAEKSDAGAREMRRRTAL